VRGHAGRARPVVALAAATLLASAACTRRPKLVEFGWDEPDTAFLRQHVERMEETPFDGCVFHATARSRDGAEASLAWGFFGRRAFTPAELAQARADLEATPLHRFRENFLRINVTPGHLDWFDDWSALLQNARLAAQLVAAGRARGVLLDTEQYEGRPFDYHAQRDAARRSFHEYAAQARRRGRQLMQAFEDGRPGLVVLLTFGYTLPWREMRRGPKPLEDTTYALLPAFIDGLVDGARSGRIVDGYEISYGYRTAEQFRAARAEITSGVLPIVADPERYRAVVRVGFGLWLDFAWRLHGWSPVTVDGNYFTPQAFENAARAALEQADSYVWIYTEQPRWWSASGTPLKLPGVYQRALWRAREQARR
jgi:hypothetical protein